MTKRIAGMTIAMCLGLANVMTTIAQAQPQDEKTQSGEKMNDDKMKSDKMAGGKMTSTGKMAGDKMTSTGKMAGDKMTSTGKMAGDKKAGDMMGTTKSKKDNTDDKGKMDEPKN